MPTTIGTIPGPTEGVTRDSATRDARSSRDAADKRNRTRVGGSFRFDRDFKRLGLGRMQFTSGTTDPEEFKYRNGVLTRLAKRKPGDTIHAIHSGTVSWDDVHRADGEGRLHLLLSDQRAEQRRKQDAPWMERVAEVESLRLWRRPQEPADATIVTVLETVVPAMIVGNRPNSDKTTRRRYLTSLRSLRDHDADFLGPWATIGDLLDKSLQDWKALSDSWERSPSDWNHLRSMISRVLSEVLGNKHHTARVRTMTVMKKRIVAQRPVDITPAMFVELMNEMPVHLYAVPMALVLTGMRIGEYFSTTARDLSPHTQVVHVGGHKTEGSEGSVSVAPELWHWIEAAVPCPVSYRTLWGYWWDARVAVGKRYGMIDEEPLDVRLHDLRHLHGQWAVDGGAQIDEVKTSLRHASLSMTARYLYRSHGRNVATSIATTLQGSSVNSAVRQDQPPSVDAK